MDSAIDSQIRGSSFCVSKIQRDGGIERENDIRNLIFLFHIDADCLYAVVTMSSGHKPNKP